MKVPALNDFKRTFHDPVWVAVADTILESNDVEFRNLQRAEHGENIVFLVDDRLVLKIYTPLKNGYRRELVGLEFAQGKIPFPIPHVVEAASFEGFQYLITTQLGGRSMLRSDWLGLDRQVQTKFVVRLATGLRDFHHARPTEVSFDWREFLEIQMVSAVEKQRSEGGNPEWVASMPAYFEKHRSLLPPTVPDAFMHGDVHFGNFRVGDEKGELRIRGLFDFADSLKGYHEYEFIAIGVLMLQGQGELQREFFRAYGYRDDEINDELRTRMFLLTMLYEYSSLARYCARLGIDPMDYRLGELERAIWNF